MRDLITMHMDSLETEIERMEGKGALNFLALDDTPLADEGEDIEPESIISLEFDSNKPVFPVIEATSKDLFLNKIECSKKKWIIIYC